MLGGSKRKAAKIAGPRTERPRRTPSRVRPKTCHHQIAIRTWHPERPDTVISIRCSQTLGCGQQLGMGASNDDDPSVQIEFWAVAMATSGVVDELARGGYEDGAVGAAPSDSPGAWAGWLAREIQTHYDRATRDAAAWDWDATRPVSEQYPSTGPVAEVHALAVAADTIRTQTRHDVAASVQRHSFDTSDDEPICVPRTLGPPLPGYANLMVGPPARIEINVIVGAEPERTDGIEVVPVQCPRGECRDGCVAFYGSCEVEIEPPFLPEIPELTPAKLDAAEPPAAVAAAIAAIAEVTDDVGCTRDDCWISGECQIPDRCPGKRVAR